MIGWWRDVIHEAEGGVDHTRVGPDQPALWHDHVHRLGGDVFVAWFWAFFDASLFVDEAKQFVRVEATGGNWPPKGIEVFDPWHLPLLNTLILLLSGTTVTWAHHALLHNDRQGLKWGLIATVLGVLFSIVQVFEYSHAAFAFSGNIYGATFFMATGFHGFHVMIGTIFLIVCLARALQGQFTPAAASRLRIRRVVLAFRGRGLVVPVRVHLSLGLGLGPRRARNHRAVSVRRTGARRRLVPGRRHRPLPSKSMSQRSAWRVLLAPGLATALGVATLIGLGAWQIERMGAKQRLITRVEQRAHQTPQALPRSKAGDNCIQRATDYTRVELSGVFQHDKEAHVHGLLSRGSRDAFQGYCILTPLTLPDGTTSSGEPGFRADRAGRSGHAAGGASRRPADDRRLDARTPAAGPVHSPGRSGAQQLVHPRPGSDWQGVRARSPGALRGRCRCNAQSRRPAVGRDDRPDLPRQSSAIRDHVVSAGAWAFRRFRRMGPQGRQHVRRERLVSSARQSYPSNGKGLTVLHISTRGETSALGFCDVLLAGLARDGGLYVPETWPRLSAQSIAGFSGLPYAAVAETVIGPFVDGEIEPAAFRAMVQDAYATFRHPRSALWSRSGTTCMCWSSFTGRH
jgi:heme/copper-type cytochrome/quinol oxidase subunit 3